MESMIVIKNAAIKVDPKLSISKSSIHLSVTHNRKAFIRNLNNPNVIIIKGNVPI